MGVIAVIAIILGTCAISFRKGLQEEKFQGEVRELKYALTRLERASHFLRCEIEVTLCKGEEGLYLTTSSSINLPFAVKKKLKERGYFSHLNSIREGDQIREKIKICFPRKEGACLWVTNSDGKLAKILEKKERSYENLAYPKEILPSL